MSQSNWEADKMLDVYIHDYLVKRDLKDTAQAFQAEGKVSSDPVAIDAPGGFLFEWWSVFWDIFIARTNEKHSEVASSYIETQLLKAREQQQLQQQQSQQHSPQTQHQLQMQQLLFQRQQQQSQQQQQQPQQLQSQQQQPSVQQRRDGSHTSNRNADGIGGSDPLVRQNPGTANAIATKMYAERLKGPPQRDSLDEKPTKRFGENIGQILDPNHASILKSAAGGGQPSGQVLHGTAGGMSPQVHQNQQLSGAAQDIKPEIGPPLNPRGPSEGSLMGMAGSNDGGNNLTLKGRPLTGWENIRGGLLQPQKSFMQSPQAFSQFQMLPQHQQQLLLAQQSLTSPSASDESRRLRMLLNNRNIPLGKDGFPNVVGGVVPNVSSSLGGGLLQCGETDMMVKLKIAEMHQQQQQLQQQFQQNNNSQLLQQQQLPQHSPPNPQSQNSSHNIYQQDKMGGSGSVTMDGSLSNSFRGNDQVPKSQSGRKRKQPVSSSGPANSSGTANTGPSPSSTPSTPSTHAPGDVMSMPPLPHNGGPSKPLMMFGSDGSETLPSPSNHLADMDQMVDDPSLEDNVESFLSHEEADQRDAVARCMDTSKGFTFEEVISVPASSSMVSCCDFSSDGKLLATGGHDKKVVLWYADTMKQKNILDEHVGLITDVRFSPSMPRLATSSFDKTVRVWDADSQGFSLRNFAGHAASVMSLDFHPNKDDLICSCDSHGEIRYWSVNNGSCMRVFKGVMSRVRFQPRHGRFLAAVAESFVSILDVETGMCTQTLQGTKPILSICWDNSGELLASVSEDLVRVWRVGSGSEWDCLHELNCSGNKFHSCVFHPSYPSLLVIGCSQSLELWNMANNKTMTMSAHEGLVASLAASPATGFVASASHDKMVKLWK